MEMWEEEPQRALVALELWKQARPCFQEATSGLGVTVLYVLLLHLNPPNKR